MTVERRLQSIQRWLMAIALLLTIHVYYLAKNGYGDAAADGDDQLLVLFAMGFGVFIALTLAVSVFLKRPDEAASGPDLETE